MAHKEILVDNFNKRTLIVKLLKDEEKEKWDKLLKKVNAVWNKSENTPGWLVNNDRDNDLEEIIIDYEEQMERANKKSKTHKDDEKRESSESETDSDTDDELLQKALAKRIMSESSGKSIELEDIDNSDNEDVVSVCRRLRYVYSNQAKIIKALEKLNDRIDSLTISNPTPSSISSQPK